jgi:hypothetical protein
VPALWRCCVLQRQRCHQFVDDPWRQQLAALRQWLPAASNDWLLVLDIGTGLNTPIVVGWPMERTAQAIRTARLVRINRNDPKLQVRIGDRGLSIAAGALDVLPHVASLVPGLRAFNELRLSPDGLYGG